MFILYCWLSAVRTSQIQTGIEESSDEEARGNRLKLRL
jgi:hypothetical protein